MPVFKTQMLQSALETDPSPVNSKYIQNVLRRKVNDKHIFVDGKTMQRKVCGTANEVTT